MAEITNLKTQDRERLDKTTDTYSATPTPSYSYSEFNENTGSTSKNALNAEKHSRIIFVLDDKPSETIKNIYIQTILKIYVDFKYFCW